MKKYGEKKIVDDVNGKISYNQGGNTMSRTLIFELIQDTRFSDTPKGVVSKWTTKIENKLKKLPTVTIRTYPTRRVEFADGTISYRKKIHVNKETRKVTWDDIYSVINSVKACYYSFI